jgi:hypothetical protein
VEPFLSRFPSPIKVAFELNARVIDSGALESTPCCPSCDQGLSLHQPDESRPAQLLATCESCSQWYSLIELADESGELLMVELPSLSMFEGLVERLRTVRDR